MLWGGVLRPAEAVVRSHSIVPVTGTVVPIEYNLVQRVLRPAGTVARSHRARARRFVHPVGGDMGGDAPLRRSTAPLRPLRAPVRCAKHAMSPAVGCRARRQPRCPPPEG